MTASLRIDHVVYGVSDLDKAAAWLLDSHGLRCVDGGPHPGHGTANRIVPLGTDYLELLAVVDPGEAELSPLGRAVLEGTATGDQLIGWVVRTDDIHSVANRLALPVQSMSRTLPDGTELTWEVAGIAETLARPDLPFYIQWHDPRMHPGRHPADSTGPDQRIAWIGLSAIPNDLSDWLGGSELPVRVVDGDRPLTAVGIARGEVEIVLR